MLAFAKGFHDFPDGQIRTMWVNDSQVLMNGVDIT